MRIMKTENVIMEIEDALSGNLAKAGNVYNLSLNGLKDKALTDALFLLKEQNTRRCGKWKTIPHKKARVCSVCEKDEPYKFADDDADVYEYCPHCGAKMEGL